MPHPLIGITTSRQSNTAGHPLHGVLEAYINAVANAGGAPLLIPLGLSEEALLALAERLDGILLSGGGDIHPGEYGGNGHPRVDEVDLDRDRVELFLARYSRAQGQPFLGICRGFQVINVALGGTLYEDIADQRPGALKHDCFSGEPRDLLAHPVSVTPASLLAEILDGTRFEVNSLHHQGARQVAPALLATAFAPDGLVEGLELPSHPFGVAVQWHPEWLQDQAPMRALFQAFVQAARH